MKVSKKFGKRDLTKKDLLMKAVERSAQIEGLSLKNAQSNIKVILELQKHGRGFPI